MTGINVESSLTGGWQPYPGRPHIPQVSGKLLTWANFYMPQLGGRTRDVHVYLPPSYDRSDQRYPVLYMQDAQNLFDPAFTYAGVSWRVDRTMQGLANEGIEAIVVAVDHGSEARVREYNPFPDVWDGEGDRYLRFITQTLKRQIDHDFRTISDRAHTGIAGSSMGGLISLYAYYFESNVFGMVAALSPAFWIGGNRIYYAVNDSDCPRGRVYLDNGPRENNARRMAALLTQKGLVRGETLKYVYDERGEHTERDWARRLPDALRFLLQPR